MRLLLALLLVSGCAWNSPPAHSPGWHGCGNGTGCPEWWTCSRMGCEWNGDTNGPGAADAAKDSSGQNTPQR